MNLKINKNDWTGETIKVRVNQSKRTFSMYGYDFVLRPTGTLPGYGRDETSQIFSIERTTGDYPQVGQVFKLTGETWYAHDGGDSSEGCINRQSPCLYTAVVQLLCNII